ncbi:unnamed protein product [Paramecium primaurelia]|uniref:Uncharacterized protein n=1 Tax=Paramecium primaurelia TaxID=5886 RepID=A0A8S1LZG2_PARPR|nr:unnamed protein product [Paramecium primaurelia]
MQITAFTDINLFTNKQVSAHKHPINTPQIKNYSVRVNDSLISPNQYLVAIRLQINPILKEKEGFPIIQLYNVITGKELYSKSWKVDSSLISYQFSFDSSLFVILDTESLSIINVQEIHKIQIIKLKSERLISIDTDNNISLQLSNNSIMVYSPKNEFQHTLQIQNEVDYLHMLGLNYAMYSCGLYQYLLNVQNKRVLRRWMNHDFEITNQINYKNFLVIQSCGYKMKFVYIRLQQSGKIIRKYTSCNMRQGQNRIAYENSSISIFQFFYCRIKQPILNVIKNVFKIEMNVNKFDLLQGGFKQYNFQIDQDYDQRKEIPIYFLNGNQLNYYLFI